MGRRRTMLARRSEGAAGRGGYLFLSEWRPTILARETEADRPWGYHHVVWGLSVTALLFSLLPPKNT